MAQDNNFHFIIYVNATFPTPPIRFEYSMYKDYSVKELRTIICNMTGYKNDFFEIYTITFGNLNDTYKLYDCCNKNCKNVIFIERIKKFSSYEYNSLYQIDERIRNPFEIINFRKFTILPFENMIDEDESGKCVVCYEKKYEILFMNCRHACVCQICSNKLDICPICQSKIQNKMKLSNITKNEKIYYAYYT
jgi:hypothetical protein